MVGKGNSKWEDNLRNESNGASGTPVKLVIAFLGEFRGLTHNLTRRSDFVDLQAAEGTLWPRGKASSYKGK
jgi:hypothetical protein